MELEQQIDSLIKDLCDSKSLTKPDPNAGYLLVDPVIPAAIQYWWEEFKSNLKRIGG